MSNVDILQTITLVALAAGLLLYFRIKGASDDGPIRVKGGSIEIYGDNDWELDGNEFKLKEGYSGATYFRVWITLDGAKDGPYFCRSIQLDMQVAPPTVASASRTNIKVAPGNGVRVEQPGTLTLPERKKLKHANEAAFMQYVELLGGPSGKSFGPFEPRQSNNLKVDVWPV